MIRAFEPADQSTVRKEEHWFVAYWRPAMAWAYLSICVFDFIVAPILVGLLSLATHQPYHGWVPLTLEGGGLFHLAMGTVTGVTAWSRGQEKITSISGFNSVPTYGPYQPYSPYEGPVPGPFEAPGMNPLNPSMPTVTSTENDFEFGAKGTPPPSSRGNR
jgi:hypothetical protein